MRRFRDFIERFAVGDPVGGGVCGGGGSVKKKISGGEREVSGCECMRLNNLRCYVRLHTFFATINPPGAAAQGLTLALSKSFSHISSRQ